MINRINVTKSRPELWCRNLATLFRKKALYTDKAKNLLNLINVITA